MSRDIYQATSRSKAAMDWFEALADTNPQLREHIMGLAREMRQNAASKQPRTDERKGLHGFTIAGAVETIILSFLFLDEKGL